MTRRTAGDASDGANSRPPPYEQYRETPPRHTHFQDPTETQPFLSVPRGSYGTCESGIRIVMIPQTTKWRFLILGAVIIFFIGYYTDMLFDMERRRQWDREEENRNIVREAWEEEGRGIRNDRIRWDQERKNKEDQESYEREEESRKRRGIGWDGLHPPGCCATRRWNTPRCQNKSIRIHGRGIFPSRCEDQVRNSCMIVYRNGD
ncbi:hypothetical protein BDZ97DRAFT_1820228 [Flammula alnicola]|nr:hypothetical protein BDZ97DRAFT_1820228 [Flammula alnicola]